MSGTGSAGSGCFGAGGGRMGRTNGAGAIVAVGATGSGGPGSPKVGPGCGTGSGLGVGGLGTIGRGGSTIAGFGTGLRGGDLGADRSRPRMCSANEPRQYLSCPQQRPIDSACQSHCEPKRSSPRLQGPEGWRVRSRGWRVTYAQVVGRSRVEAHTGMSCIGNPPLVRHIRLNVALPDR